MPRAEPPGTPFSSSRPATERATPTQAAAATGVRKSDERDHRGQDDVEARDEPRARDGRQVEPCGLEPVRDGEQSTGTEAGRDAAPRAARRASARRTGPARASRSRNAPRGTRTAGRPRLPPARARRCSPRSRSRRRAPASGRGVAVAPAQATLRAATDEAGSLGRASAGYPARDDGHGHHGPEPARPADLGHGPVQLPLRLLHAERGVRPQLPVHGPQGAADVRGDRADRARLRRRTGSRRSGSPAASRSCAATWRSSSSGSWRSAGSTSR